jgi:hypothetical protein
LHISASSRRISAATPRPTVTPTRRLQNAGSTQGCTREEVEAAFAHLIDPAIKAAARLDHDRIAIVTLKPAADAS